MSERETTIGSAEEQTPASRTARAYGRHEVTSDALLSEVERIARLGGFIWSRSDDEVHWSDELYRLLGYDAEGVRPSVEAFLAAVHPDDRERVRVSWGAAREGTLFSAEYRIRRRDTGELRYMRSSGHNVWEDGQVRQIIGAVQDITEAKRSAFALEEALAVTSAAERVAGIGSFVLRVEPSETMWTEGLKALTGIDPACSGHPQPLDKIHPEDRAKHVVWWERLLREHVAEPLSVRVLLPEGGVRHLHTQAALVRLADGVARVVGTTVDVTERVQLEEQLRHAAKMEAIGTLAAGVAHDFNNYLMVLDQSLSMLDDSEGQEREELIASGRLALSRCRDLTRQLLAFARRQPFSPESVDLVEVVRPFYDLLNRAIGRRATLRMELGAGPLWCRVDPHHVERMLTNLIVNAADAIEETRREGGRITVRLERLELSTTRRAVPGDVPPGTYACIIVEDNGGGIEPSRLPRIFEPYFTTKPAGRGTGLGLASVYGMARQNDGVVTVSEVPAGTRFTLRFPHIDARQAVSVSGHLSVGAQRPRRSMFDHQVLIVEDLDEVRETAERILSAAGFRTIVASNGREALEFLDSGFDVRLIITDLEMPVMGGRELAERVQHRAGPPPPVIFMTGFSEPMQTEHGELGHMLLAKPFTPERLIEFVKRALKIIDAG